MLRVPPRRLPPTAPRGGTVVGLDPSLNNFGILVITDGGVVDASVVTPGKLTGMDRILNILGRLAEYAHLGPMVREDYAYAASSGSDAQLKELGGILDYFLHCRGVRLHRVGVAQVKKFVTGAGNAKKDMMMLRVYKDFGYDPPNEHLADAFGVAAFGADLLGVPRPGKHLTHQREVVEKARKEGHPLTSFAKGASK